MRRVSSTCGLRLTTRTNGDTFSGTLLLSGFPVVGQFEIMLERFGIVFD